MNAFKVISVIIATLLIVISETVSADCMTTNRGESICGKGRCMSDRYGNVYCSSFFKGSITSLSNGDIVCGVGECVRTSKGDVYCSTEQEGFAGKDMYGVPRCQKQCELATMDKCEAIPAGR